MPGRYVVDLWLEDFADQMSLDMVADAVTFEVIPADLLGTGRLPSPVTRDQFSTGPVGACSSGRCGEHQKPG